MFSIEKTARRSKFVEWREVKQDVQLSDNKQTRSFLPEENGTTSAVLIRRAQVAGRGSQVAGHRSQVAGHRSQVAGHRLQAGHRSQVAGRRLQAANYRCKFIISFQKRSKIWTPFFLKKKIAFDMSKNIKQTAVINITEQRML